MKCIILSIVILFFVTVMPEKREKYEISGSFLGGKIETCTDDPLAAYYFNRMNKAVNIHKPNETIIESILNDLRPDPRSNRDMALLTGRTSVDFATLYFAKWLYEVPLNRFAQNYYQNTYQNLKSQSAEKSKFEKGNLDQYLFVFVPGLLYVKHNDLGGDFAAQRTILNSMGLSTHFIPTDELGLIEENASIIAKHIDSLSIEHQKIILVSASKGGPEVAFALGKLLDQQQSSHVKAWVSIGGVLRGSQIADEHTNGFRKWYAKTALFFMGAKMDIINDLTRESNVARYAGLSFPDDLLILHYVGAPLTDQVSKDVKDNFRRLAASGPNDGLTTLTDELTPRGIVITELGLDHYYRDPDIDIKAVALGWTAAMLLDEGRSSPVQMAR